MTKSVLLSFGLTLAVAAPAAAQQPSFVTPDAFHRGVPVGAATADTLPLSLSDAIKRGLDQNLGVILEQDQVQSKDSDRLRDLSALIPHISAGVRESQQVVNLASFGFTGFPGIPDVIGPFNVFDARVFVSTPIYDASALGDLRQSRANLAAEQHTYQSARETVVLVVGSLYLEAVSDRARVLAAQGQVTTANTLVQLATDQQRSGVVASIDVVRQQVQQASAQSRLIAAQNELEKDKLQLARAIGLPANQQFELTDQVPYAAAPDVTEDAGVELAFAHREDIKAAQARVDAAKAQRASAVGSALPSVHLDADYGAIGTTPSASRQTYTVVGNLRVPIFQGGNLAAKVKDADSTLRDRESELSDLQAGVRYEVTTALLDIKAADAGVKVAQGARALAAQELTEAQDRFRAGVASTIELTQAQDADTAATSQYIAATYQHNLAKAEFARAIGQVEARFLELVGGK
jgi:outer membrane protein TolC